MNQGITEHIAQQLQLKKNKSSVFISGLGDVAVATNKSYVNVSLKSRTSQFATAFTAVVVPTITGCQPNIDLDIKGWEIPSNIKLADPSFYKPIL